MEETRTAPDAGPDPRLARLNAALPALEAVVRPCRLCGRRCGADRLANVPGFCRTTSRDAHHVRCASATLHFGEEPVLVGRGGSGTVFFAHCNLRCVFCQNYQISHLGLGDDLHAEQLADTFLDLQRRGAENINLVTPTHYLYPVALGLQSALARGLRLPIVYNTNGFETQEALAVLDGVVDLYLPDLKYMDSACAGRYSGAEAYPETARAAIVEMWRQTGPLVVDNGVARRGLIIRHLVLPNDLAGSFDFLLWLKDAGLQEATLSLMSQYSPQYRASRYEELARALHPREYQDVLRFAVKLGFEHILAQGCASKDAYLPDFEQDDPFAHYR